MFDAEKCLHAVRKIPIIDLTIKGRRWYATEKTIRNNYLSTGFDETGRPEAAFLLRIGHIPGKIPCDLDEGRNNIRRACDTENRPGDEPRKMRILPNPKHR